MERIIETMEAQIATEPERVWWREQQQGGPGSYEYEQQQQYPGEWNSWVCEGGNPCEVCLNNEAAGPVKAGEPFPSGDIAPPAHDHCHCNLISADPPEQPRPIVPVPPTAPGGGGGTGAFEV